MEDPFWCHLNVLLKPHGSIVFDETLQVRSCLAVSTWEARCLLFSVTYFGRNFSTQGTARAL